MRIYSYRPEGSALAKHFQSIKQSEMKNKSKIQNPVLSLPKHDFTSKSLLNKKEQIYSPGRYGGSPKKTQMFMPKNRAKFKYQNKRNLKQNYDFEIKEYSFRKQQQFLTIKSIKSTSNVEDRLNINTRKKPTFHTNSQNFIKYRQIQTSLNYNKNCQQILQEPRCLILERKNRAKSAGVTGASFRKYSSYRDKRENTCRKNKRYSEEVSDIQGWDTKNDEDVYHFL